MIRFLLLLLLLPGAELVAKNTDAVESLSTTTLGAQFIMTVTPKTMLRKPLPASRGPANKTTVPHSPPPKDGKKQHSPLKDVSVKPAKVQPVGAGAIEGDSNSPPYQHGSSTPYESRLNSTKMPVTVRSPSLSESPQKRPVIRKGPTVTSKSKTPPKFTIKNPSARYQSLPHLHHKNVTSKPITGQFKDSNLTSSFTDPISPLPQRTATVPVRNAFKAGQKVMPFRADRVKQFPVASQAVTQIGRQLKEKSSNTSVLLNNLVHQNSSFFTNSLQHMAQSSNSTFTTGKEAVLYELNSLNTRNHLNLNSENVTSVPEGDRHNDVSRAGLLRQVNLPGDPDSKVMQELKSKVNIRIPDAGIFTHTNMSSTELSGLVREDRVQLHPESTTQTSNIERTQMDLLSTERTFDSVSHSSGHSHGLTESATGVQSHTTAGVDTHAKKERVHLGMAGGHHIHRNVTHSHKHRHQSPDSPNQTENNTISQHKNTQYDITADSPPNRHHQKHLHNHTQHSHHKHHVNHHLHRNHVSQTLVPFNAPEQLDLTTRIQPSESNSQQHHTQLVNSTQNNTHFSTSVSSPSYTAAQQKNEGRSSTAEGLLGISRTAQPSQITQTGLDSQPELTSPSGGPTTHSSISVTTNVHNISKEEVGRYEVYPSVHTKPFIHRHSGPHTAKYNVTTHFQIAEQPQLDHTPNTIVDRITQNQTVTGSSHEELTTPTQEQETIKTHQNPMFGSLPELSTSEEGLSTQTQPRVITPKLPHLSTLSTDQGGSTRSVMSTKKPFNLTTESPIIALTVLSPLLTTQSHSEPSRKYIPVSTPVFNVTQPELTRHSKESVLNLTTQNSLEFSTYTEPITYNDLESSSETNLKVTTESINTTILSLQSRTTADFETVPVTKSRVEFTAQSEPTSMVDSTTKQNSTMLSKSHATAKPEQVTDKTQNQTGPTTNTESFTHTEWLESTTEHSTDFTHTEPITTQVAELDTKKEQTPANSTDAFTQTSVTVHGRDKTEPAMQFETRPSNKTDLIPKTSDPYPSVYTSYKGLLKSNTGTSHPPITWTRPALSMNANREANMQTSGDQSVDVYTSTERTFLTTHTDITKTRTEGSTQTITGGYQNYSHTDVPYTETTPAWDVETSPTSGFTLEQHQDHASTEKNYGSGSPRSTKSVISPQSNTVTVQTLVEMMSSPSGRDRIFIVDEQPPIFKVPTISVTYKVNVQPSAMCGDIEPCKKRFSKEVTSAYRHTAAFDRADVLNVTLVGAALEYKVQFSVRVGTPMSVEQELVLANPTSMFEALAPSEYTVLSAIRNTSLAGTAEPCTEWFSCPRGFRCTPQRKLSAFCLSPCHSTFCQNDGICIHRKGQEPMCQCPVGRDFWYMGPACDYRMTHHRLAAIACAVVFCIIICAAAAVFILVRRFQSQILQQKVAQTQSSYRRFSRFDDVPTHFWCPSQTWLTTSASINSLDNPAFSSSEEVFPLQALGSCVCGCQDGARNNAPTNPAQQPLRAPPRLETSCSSVNDLMVDSGKASDVSVCSWPMEPIHWTPFPILHQLSLQSPFHARRPHSYFEGMELVNTERSWTA